MSSLKTGLITSASFLTAFLLYAAYALVLAFGYEDFKAVLYGYFHNYHWLGVPIGLSICTGVATAGVALIYRRQTYPWWQLYLPIAMVCFAWGVIIAEDAYRTMNMLRDEPYYLNAYDPHTVPEYFLQFGLICAVPAALFVLLWGMILRLGKGKKLDKVMSIQK